MIAGNVCLNRLYGITYPVFGSQKVSSVVSMDTSVPFNTNTTETRVIAGGMNTIGVAKAASSNANNSNSASSTGGSGTIGGPVVPPVVGVP